MENFIFGAVMDKMKSNIANVTKTSNLFVKV